MTNRQRFLVIIQLCLAFSAVLWFFVQPFMGEYFSIRSNMLLYEYVMGTSDILKNPGFKEKVEKNITRFQKLPLIDKEVITHNYQKLKNYAHRTASTKIADGIKILFYYIPAFQLAWIFFAIVIGIMLLLNKPGANWAAWLLPVIALCYGIDNYQNGKVLSSKDSSLFPTEKEIVDAYFSNRLNRNSISREELKEAWDFYLVKYWTKDSKRSGRTETTESRLDDAKFNFTVARLLLMQNVNPNQLFFSFHEKSNIWLLALYFLWNLYFAKMMTGSRFLRKTKHHSKCILKSLTQKQ